MDDVADKEQLPCGCVIGSWRGAVVYEPCCPACTYYQYALTETARQGKPIAFDSDVDNV